MTNTNDAPFATFDQFTDELDALPVPVTPHVRSILKALQYETCTVKELRELMPHLEAAMANTLLEETLRRFGDDSLARSLLEMIAGSRALPLSLRSVLVDLWAHRTGGWVRYFPRNQHCSQAEVAQ